MSHLRYRKADATDVIGIPEKSPLVDLDDKKYSKEVLPSVQSESPPPWSHKSILFILTLLALAVRLYILGTPPAVVFDEVHFGGFATKYMRAGFFMDVHPPLVIYTSLAS
jgi:dolichyl-phosphate-mannose--protein O-mannosyl transferase